MKAIAKTRPALGAEIIDTPVPRPGEGELLVKVAACGICGSDLHIYEWELGADRMVARLPAVIGHEPAGEVVEVGAGVTTSRPAITSRSIRSAIADDAARAPPDASIYCDFADASRRRVRRILHRAGRAIPGWCRNRWTWRPPRCSSRSPPACMRSSNHRPQGRRQRVVEGPGPIGLSVALSARALGVTSIVITGLEVDAERLALAREMGFKTVCAGDGDWIEQVRALLPPDGADVVFDAVGVIDSARELVRTRRRAGRTRMAGARRRRRPSCARCFSTASRSSTRACARPRPGGARSRWWRAARSILGRW